MTLDNNEKIFLVPMKKTKKRQYYAQFRFKPYTMMEKFLDDYNINYQESEERFSGVHLINSGQQSLVWYKIKTKNISDREYHQFGFTSDIIDKVLDFYNIEYEKRTHL